MISERMARSFASRALRKTSTCTGLKLSTAIDHRVSFLRYVLRNSGLPELFMAQLAKPIVRGT